MTRSTTKKTTGFFAFIMVAVLLAACLPLTVFGANEELLPFDSQTTENTIGEADALSVSENTSVSTGDVIGEYVEDVSRREENVKHFALPDGTYTAIVYPAAVHRKDADGVWQDINNDLTLSSVSENERFVTSDSRVSFSSRFTSNNELMTLSENGYTISMSLLSDSKNELTMSTEAQTFALASVTNAAKKELPKTDVKLEDVAKVDNKSSIVYNNVRANTNIEYILDGNDVKENIIVKAPLSEYEYSFDLRLGGLVAILNENGSISINDAETGAGKYKMPAPYMYDANGEVSYAVEYTLIEVSSGRYLLIITADKTWINADGREFPVTIDPTIEDHTILYDTHISNIHPNESYFAEQNLCVCWNCTALIKLDLPTIPEDAEFTSSNIVFNHYFETYQADMSELGIYQITSSWTEEYTTYNSAPSISSTLIDSIGLFVDEREANAIAQVSLNITELVRAWYYEGVANNGVAIKFESGVYAVKIKSYDSGSNFCEYLEVNYEYDFSEGIYAFENVVCENSWMTTSNEILQHAQLSESPMVCFSNNQTEEDIRIKLFKISKQESTGLYIIRSMVDNNMVLTFDDNKFMFEYRYESDEDMPIGYTFSIYAGEYGILMKSSLSGERYIGIGNEGIYNLTDLTMEQSDYKIYWNYVKYDEERGLKYGVDVGEYSKVETGTVVLFHPQVWCTESGYNITEFKLSVYYPTTQITWDWDLDTNFLIVNFHISGIFELSWEMSNGESTRYGTCTIESIPIVPDGIYYIVNDEYKLYLEYDEVSDINAEIPELIINKFVYNNYQKWNIIHVTDSYYKIMVSENEVLAVNETSVIIKDIATNDYDNILWGIYKSGENYIIRPKSMTNCRIAVSKDSLNGDGLGNPAELVYDTNINSYYYGWQIIKLSESEVVLLGITDQNHNHVSSLHSAANDLVHLGYLGANMIVTSSVSLEMVQDNLQKAKIFVSRSHGETDSTGSYLSLSQYSSAHRLSSSDIYNFDTQTSVIDLSNCDLAVFVACYTGANSPYSLVDAAVAAGAKVAIGFETSIDCVDANNWVNKFFDSYCGGYTIDAAVRNACNNLSISYETVYYIER